MGAVTMQPLFLVICGDHTLLEKGHLGDSETKAADVEL
jgi:hypothetical protein